MRADPEQNDYQEKNRCLRRPREDVLADGCCLLLLLLLSVIDMLLLQLLLLVAAAG